MAEQIVDDNLKSVILCNEYEKEALVTNSETHTTNSSDDYKADPDVQDWIKHFQDKILPKYPSLRGNDIVKLLPFDNVNSVNDDDKLLSSKNDLNETLMGHSTECDDDAGEIEQNDENHKLNNDGVNMDNDNETLLGMASINRKIEFKFNDKTKQNAKLSAVSVQLLPPKSVVITVEDDNVNDDIQAYSSSDSNINLNFMKANNGKKDEGELCSDDDYDELNLIEFDKLRLQHFGDLQAQIQQRDEQISKKDKKIKKLLSVILRLSQKSQ